MDPGFRRDDSIVLSRDDSVVLSRDDGVVVVVTTSEELDSGLRRDDDEKPPPPYPQTSRSTRAKFPPRIFAIRASECPRFESIPANTSNLFATFKSGMNM